MSNKCTLSFCSHSCRKLLHNSRGIKAQQLNDHSWPGWNGHQFKPIQPKLKHPLPPLSPPSYPISSPNKLNNSWVDSGLGTDGSLRGSRRTGSTGNLVVRLVAQKDTPTVYMRCCCFLKTGSTTKPAATECQCCMYNVTAATSKPHPAQTCSHYCISRFLFIFFFPRGFRQHLQESHHGKNYFSTV